MRLFNRYFTAYDLILPFGDVVLTVLATLVARFLVLFAHDADVTGWNQWIVLAGWIAVNVVLSFYYAELYEIDQALSQRELILRFANGFGIACIFIAVFSYPIEQPGLKRIFLIEIFLMGLGLFAWRLLFARILMKRGVYGTIAIIGTQKIGMLVAETLAQKKHLGMKVAYFVGPEAGEITLSYGNPRRITIPIAAPESTVALVEQQGISRILIAGPERGQRFPAQELVTLRLKGIPIEECHTFYERLMSKISITNLRPSWILFSQGFQRTSWIMFTKRAMDLVASVCGLVLSVPITLITALAIKLDSPGPVLYRQERVGQNEKSFMLYKFRSMICEAEAECGPCWAGKTDPRVTRVGSIIRKLRIDEIPQMLNVFKGEMSFVGPRPERPFFVSQLKEKIPYYQFRFSVKPGITGWAQISYPYGDSEADAIEKLQFDLYYTKYLSPVFDLQILFETVKVIFLGRGAR
jgi:sugar transferase (PEP-CTERM system associated)